jgi:hypothetical protein
MPTIVISLTLRRVDLHAAARALPERETVHGDFGLIFHTGTRVRKPIENLSIDPEKRAKLPNFAPLLFVEFSNSWKFLNVIGR